MFCIFSQKGKYTLLLNKGEFLYNEVFVVRNILTKGL